jgi:hypothetical protein
MGAATVGNVLGVSATGIASWIPAASTGSILTYISAGATLGNGTIGKPYGTIQEAVTAVGNVETQKTFVICPGTYAAGATFFRNSSFIGIGIPRITGNLTLDATVVAVQGSIIIEGLNLTGLVSAVFNTHTTEYMTVAIKDSYISGNITMTGSVFAGSTLELNNVQQGAAVTAITASAGTVINSRLGTFNFTTIASHPLSVDQSNIGALTMNVDASTVISLLNSSILSTSLTGAALITRDVLSSDCAVIATEVIVDTGSGVKKVGNSVGLGSSLNLASAGVETFANSTLIGVGSTVTGAFTDCISIGYNADAIATGEMALAPAIGHLRAPGLTGHAGAVQMTYDATTKVINYLVSVRSRKHDIESLDEDESVRIIEELNPRSSKWNENDTEDVGFVADEVEAVHEMLAAYNENDEVVSINYFKLIPHMVKVLQKLLAEKNN